MKISFRHLFDSAAYRLFSGRSIRTKLAIGFGMLLALGALNIGLHYWGANRRIEAWNDVQRAIERQALITEAMDRLQDQKKLVELFSGVIGVQDAVPPSESEQLHFAEGVDAIPAVIEAIIPLADPARRPAVDSLHLATIQLAESWKKFYVHQWTDPSLAIAELYSRAEPLATTLLTEQMPQAVQYEKAALSGLSAQFVETDRAFVRITWICFILSALLGGLLALFISHDILQSVSALNAGAERIGAGSLDHRIEVQSQDELGDVARSFNAMAARLEQRTEELAAQRDMIEEQRDDLTRTLEHLKRTQAQLVQQEKLASLGALTAGIAHEIKNPLNFINNFAALCEELSDELVQGGRHPDPDELTETLSALRISAKKIREHGQRADDIIKSMLLHSRGKPGDRQVVDVNELLDEYVNLAFHGMRAQKANFNVRLRRRFDEKIENLEVVPQELGRVFINLLSNAFYAVYDKAALGGDGYEPCVDVATVRRRDGIEIRISDNGTGIPEDVRTRIFEPFFTTKPTGEGTGLGLSLSYDIVTQVHGGTLDVASESGVGTTFTIKLPV